MSCLHAHMGAWDPHKHEEVARQGGFRMFVGLRQREARSNP